MTLGPLRPGVRASAVHSKPLHALTMPELFRNSEICEQQMLAWSGLTEDVSGLNPERAATRWARELAILNREMQKRWNATPIGVSLST